MSDTTPLVTLLMGSDSDWPDLQGCYDTLKEFGIEVEVKVCSAHRTPDDAAEFAANAHKNGRQVLIAAAGMAAHLGGVLAAHSPLPIIGIPMASGALPGSDALLSTVQMPPGVPVACVGIGKPGAKNAALLAVQIMATANPDLQKKFIEYKAKMADQVRQKNQKLQEQLK